jgi:putative ABC transport system ATP-binding protein
MVKPHGSGVPGAYSVFELSHVSLARNGKHILRSVDWQVGSGQITVLLGPTGSGKTSLLRLLNRLQEATSGEIRYMGEPIGEKNIQDLRREVGMVLQQPFLFEGTVLDNMLYGSRLHGLDVDAAWLAGLAGIDADMLAQDSSTLSVGQSQKVSIARAVAVNPRVLLLDEPTSGLDPTATFQIEEMLTGLVDKLSLTCVFVTHHIEQARRLGQRGILLIDGAVVEEGDMEGMLSSPADERTRKFIRGELR